MSLLIKGGEVVDGKGRSPVRSDVLVAGGRIAAIGDLASYRADETINANGCFVVPGFINSAAVSDRHLSFFSDRTKEDLLLEGITTAVCGNGGISLAPLLYNSLEGISPWSKWESLNIDWHSFSGLLSIVDNLRFGINFAFFVGYDSVKNSITKKRRGLNQDESLMAIHSFVKSFREGSIGLSVSSETLEGEYVSPDESKNLRSFLKENPATIAIDLPFGEKKPSDSVNKAMDWASYGGSAIINHFSRAAISKQETGKCLQILENSSISSRTVASICPLPFEEISLYDIIPESAIGRSARETAANIGKKRNSATLEKEWPVERLAKLWITDSPKADFLTGKNVAEFLTNREVGVAECFIKLIEISEGRISFLLETERDENHNQIITDPRVIIRSLSYESMKHRSDFHKKFAGSFVRFLEIASEIGMPIEKAITKITSLPAAICSLSKRGLIEEGCAADITILKDKKPEWVIMNGIVAVRDGTVTENRGGRAIKRNV